MRSATLILVSCICLSGGCSTDSPAENGTVQLLFPEWEKSDSAFEREVFLDYYILRCNDGWYVRELQHDGALKPFWKNDAPRSTIADVKKGFEVNLRWAAYRAVYDYFAENL